MSGNELDARDEASQRFNLRDYGGYETIDGRRLVSGRLFRSAEPDRAGYDCAARFESLRLAAIIDFRSRVEIPCPERGLPKLAHLRVAAEEDEGEDDAIAPHALERFRGLSQASEARAVMRDVYREMITGHQFLAMTGRYLHALAEAQGPTLVHCVAGKDRTGLAVALFHALMGVKPDAIMHEYLLTNAAGQTRIDRLLSSLSGHAALRSVPPQVLEELLGVREEYLHTALAIIGKNANDTADYLHRHAGIDKDLPAQLRRNYLAAPHAE